MLNTESLLRGRERCRLSPQQHRIFRHLSLFLSIPQGKQSALHQDIYHGFSIGSRTTDIVNRAGSRRGHFGGAQNDLVSQFFADQIRFGFRSVNDGRSDCAQGDDRLFYVPGFQIQHNGCIDQRNGLGTAQTQFQECSALAVIAGRLGSKRRERNIHQHFVSLHHCFSNTGIKFFQGHLACANGRSKHHPGSQRHKRCDGIVGRAGCDEITCHCGSVTDLRCTHLPGRTNQRKGTLAQ